MSLSLDHLLESLQRESKKSPNPLRERELSPADVLQKHVKTMSALSRFLYLVRDNEEDATICMNAIRAEEKELQAAFESFLQSTSN